MLFEQIKSEINELPAKIEFFNGKVKYGIILDYPEEESIDNLKFIEFNNLLKYEKTEDPKLIESIERESVISVDMMLK